MALLDLIGVSVDLGAPERSVLADVSFAVEPGTISLILGPNGCGKSVLLRTILGLVPRFRGELLFRHVSLRGRFRALHQSCGVVFQNPDQQLFGNTVREDLLIGTPDREAPDPDLVRNMDVEELLERAPAELSGGQRRRVAIAGALASTPDLLILDEPFIELDYPSLERVIAQLCSLRDRGTAVLLASHESQDIWPVVDTLLILREGHVLYNGPPVRGRNFITPENGLRPLSAEYRT